MNIELRHLRYFAAVALGVARDGVFDG